MTLVRRDNGNQATRYARDPFALARDLFNWEFGDNRQVSTFVPTFEVKETTEQFLIRADMPGVKDEDLDISMHNGVLSVTGRRAAEERKEGETFYLYERQYGSFSRSFALPDTADAEKIDAKLKDGVLSVSIGKRVEAKPRKIALQK
jgi:HSP20 family protein